MRAVWYERNGPAREVLTFGEMPIPAVGPGQVRVRVRASSVNPIDIKRRSGVPATYDTPMPFPRIIPHDDGAGEIEAVGPGVDASRLGKRVWVYLAQARRIQGPPELRDGRAFGTAAEFVVLPSFLALDLPDVVGFREASVIGIPAITAHRCVHADGPVSGKTLLIAGGAGSVGQYAIQFAKAAGATVIATISGAEKRAIAIGLGADHVVDYREQGTDQHILDLTSGRGVDSICETDFAANLEFNIKVLRPQGIINTFGSDTNQAPQVQIGAMNKKEATVRFVYYYMLSNEAFDEAIHSIQRMLQANSLKHPVADIYSLEHTADAHEAVEAKTVLGKGVIEIG
jgi:NADPH:quinone reductase